MVRINFENILVGFFLKMIKKGSLVKNDVVYILDGKMCEGVYLMNVKIIL